MTDAPRTRTATTRVSVLFAAGALALAGCADTQETNGTDPAAQTSAPAPAATTDSSSTAASADPAAAVADALAASRAASSGHLEAITDTRTGEQTTTSTTTGVFSDTALRMEITTQIPGRGQSALEIRQVDGSAYLYGLPGLAPDQWVQAPLDELGAAAGTAGTADPSQRLVLLEQAADVQRTGDQDVNGVQATGYTGTIDLQAVAEETLETSGSGVGAEQLRQQYEQAGLSTIPFELYVDADGLPVRMVTTVETTVGEQTSTTTSTVDLSDWGTQVDVEVPDGAVPINEVAPTSAPAR